ncbi:MAG: hypothetical protein MUF64_12735 [Polyangiaceae bacterium]|jgi:hypothetical protein|nr:hypothetical protein [Polyangiaceae bacterium]
MSSLRGQPPATVSRISIRAKGAGKGGAPPAAPQPGGPAQEPEDGEVSKATLHTILLEQQQQAREDPFTKAVLRQLGPELLASFTDDQRCRLERALFACRPLQRHPVDIRGVIPLFFWRFYYVLLLGRDRRRRTQQQELERRKQAGLVADLIFALSVILQVLAVVVVVLYLIKSALGIDLLKKHHAWELLLD